VRVDASWITIAVVFLLFIDLAGVLVDDHGAPAAVGALIILVLAVPFLASVRRGHVPVVPATLVIMLVYLLAQIVSTVLSPDPREPFNIEVQQFILEGLALVFLIVNTVRTRQVLRKALWAVAIGGLFLGALTVHQWATAAWSRPYSGFAQLPLDYLSGYAASPRSNGPVGDPNYFAQLMLVPAVVTPFLLRDERRRSARLVLWASLIAAFAAILLTYSRGAGLAGLIALVAAISLREVKGRTLLVLGIVAALVLATVPAYRDRLGSVTEVTQATQAEGTEGAADVSIRGRATEVLAGAAAFSDHPVTGVGPGMFPSHYQEYARRVGLQVHESVRFGEHRGEIPEREVHNLFVGIGADTGLFGLLSFLAALGVTLVAIIRSRRHASPELKNMLTGLFLALLAYVSAGVFLSFAFERYYWLLLALGVSAARIAETEKLGSSDALGIDGA
jgi:putative inorganic carbon (HCO3(-)) transporter